MKTLLILPLALASADAAVAAQCESEPAHAQNATRVSYQEPARDIVDTAVAAGSFKTLATALKLTGLDQALRGKGPFTVLAPTDEAFAKLPAGTLETLTKPENKALLASILKFHVVSGRVGSSAVVQTMDAATLNGQRVRVNFDDGALSINGANVVKADIGCSNGVIHVIDKVLIPSTKDIVETAVAAGSFKTLAAALQAAGLVEALQGDGPFTVFAPTDDAFAKLPKNTVQDLLKPENKDKLTAILTYHVVPGRVYARDAVRAANASTLQGGNVALALVEGRLNVNGAKVVKTNIETANGVIHVIDTVLLPQ